MAKMRNIHEVSTEIFTYIPETRSFSIEASTVAANNFFEPVRIYDDSCDIGFYLVSKKTGKKILFVEVGEHINNDGELTHWEYSSYCLNENPADLLDLKVLIWND